MGKKFKLAKRYIIGKLYIIYTHKKKTSKNNVKFEIKLKDDLRAIKCCTVCKIV